jgi:hypothetical protein
MASMTAPTATMKKMKYVHHRCVDAARRMPNATVTTIWIARDRNTPRAVFWPLGDAQSSIPRVHFE